MPRRAARMLCVAAALAVAGCFLPDRFEAELEIEDDGTARLAYAGELVYVLGWAELFAERTDVDAPEFRTVLETIRSDPRTERARLTGEARYTLTWETTAAVSAGERIAFPPAGVPALRVVPGPDGTVELRGRNLSEADVRELERLGLRLRGTLSVEADGEVLDHNADEVSGLFTETHIWRFDALRDRPPYLKMRIESD